MKTITHILNRPNPVQSADYSTFNGLWAPPFQSKLDRDRKLLNAWRHLNPAVWPEVCRFRTKACKQELARNNSKTKRNNFVKITPRMIHSHISLSQKKQTESAKKARGEPETLTGVCVNSWPRWRQRTWLYPFPPSNHFPGDSLRPRCYRHTHKCTVYK